MEKSLQENVQRTEEEGENKRKQCKNQRTKQETNKKIKTENEETHFVKQRYY